jgi:hypothetical protein
MRPLRAPNGAMSMHLTRTGFNAIVLVWLVPAIIMGFVGNATATGIASDIYYWMTLLSVALALYAGFQCYRPDNTMNASEAQRRQDDHHDDSVVSFTNIDAIEYVYCGVLVVLALGSWWFHHSVNKDATGLLAMASMIWSWLDLIVAGVAGLQFWRLKSGAIVAVSRRLVSN